MSKKNPIRWAFLGIPIFTRVYKQEKNARYSVRYKILGGLIQFQTGSSNLFRVQLLGLSLFSRKYNWCKLLGIPINRHDSQKKWLSDLHIDKRYDDVYIIRHNIGESYIELMHLANRIEANKSRRPLLILWNSKYRGFYEMFLPNGCDLQYIERDQLEIHNAFTEQMLELDGQRFFCSTPDIAPKMKKQLSHDINVNFYSWILENSGIKLTAIPASPTINPRTEARVESVIKQLELGEKFVIICPEAGSLKTTSPDFWNKIVSGLRSNGYEVFNNVWNKNKLIPNTKSFRLSIDEIFILAQKSAGVITLGSGLSVLLTGAGTKMDLLYNDFEDKKIGCNATLAIRLYSVLHLPNVSNDLIKEYDMDKATENEVVKTILKRY